MKTTSAFNAAFILALLSFSSSCNGQSEIDEAFENSSFAFIGLPTNVGPVDTSRGWAQEGQRLLLTGIVYQRDGRTPAPNVLMYYYQTNSEGRYVHKPEEPRSMPPNDRGQTHGYIRGWVKTDSRGRYWIYTVRPGTYPTRDFPAHVHATIKEPNTIREYYIDDFVFDDDILVTSAYRQRMENRGGSGVLRLVRKENLQIGERNIILGLNIPDYPNKSLKEINSGKNIGEDVLSFTPYHAWGADKGTKACPVCKYGWFHGILYFVGNNPNWSEVRQWLTFLDAESKRREKYLKVYFVYGNEEDYSKSDRERELEKLGRELKLEKVALTFVPSFSDRASDVYLNNINQAVENTFLIYKRSKVIDKRVNLKPTQSNFNILAQRLDETVNEFFYLR